jgi:hypothetical protein
MPSKKTRTVSSGSERRERATIFKEKEKTPLLWFYGLNLGLTLGLYTAG